MANTVILKWNPSISSYSMFQYLQDIVYMETDSNWSIWDYDKVKIGDVFYMLKVGKGQNGVVMYGKISSDPSAGNDWSGQGRKTYYCDYQAEIMINPDTFPLLTSEELQEGIPDFDWFAGHSGIVLNREQSSKLNALWNDYLANCREEFSSRWDLIDRRQMMNDQLCVAPELMERLFN